MFGPGGESSGCANHQHFFCFRLDFDIDGTQNNAVLELNTESAKPGKDNPRGEWFSMTEHPLKTKQEAQRNLNVATGRKWKIVNLKTANGLGQLTGYTLMPGGLDSFPVSGIGYQAKSRLHQLAFVGDPL